MNALGQKKTEELKKPRCQFKRKINVIDEILETLYMFYKNTRRNKENVELMDMNSTTDDNSGIYMIVHPNSKHRYIGQTSNFKRRKREHWTELAKAMKGNKCDKKYRQMIKTPTPGLWIMIKLYVEKYKYVKKKENSHFVFCSSKNFKKK